MKSRSIFLGLFLVFIMGGVSAHNKVVVVPLGGSDAQFKPLKNIITVAKAEGDFTNIQAAIDSIADASASNPYLIVIGPGTYNIGSSIATKEHVSIAGSGPGSTILEGSVSDSSGNFDSAAAVHLVANVRLSNLTVNNSSGSSSYTIGISIHDSKTLQENIVIDNVAVNVSGAPTNSTRGIYVENGVVRINNADIAVTGANRNYGIRTYTGETHIENSRISVSTGSFSNRAVYSRSASDTHISHSVLSATGSSATALHGPATVKYSTLTSSDFSIESSSDMRVFWSILNSETSDATGNIIECILSTNADNEMLHGACSSGSMMN